MAHDNKPDMRSFLLTSAESRGLARREGGKAQNADFRETGHILAMRSAALRQESRPALTPWKRTYEVAS